MADYVLTCKICGDRSVLPNRPRVCPMCRAPIELAETGRQGPEPTAKKPAPRKPPPGGKPARKAPARAATGGRPPPPQGLGDDAAARRAGAIFRSTARSAWRVASTGFVLGLLLWPTPLVEITDRGLSTGGVSRDTDADGEEGARQTPAYAVYVRPPPMEEIEPTKALSIDEPQPQVTPPEEPGAGAASGGSPAAAADPGKPDDEEGADGAAAGRPDTEAGTPEDELAAGPGRKESAPGPPSEKDAETGEPDPEFEAPRPPDPDEVAQSPLELASIGSRTESRDRAPGGDGSGSESESQEREPGPDGGSGGTGTDREEGEEDAGGRDLRSGEAGGVPPDTDGRGTDFDPVTSAAFAPSPLQECPPGEDPPRDPISTIVIMDASVSMGLPATVDVATEDRLDRAIEAGDEAARTEYRTLLGTLAPSRLDVAKSAFASAMLRLPERIDVGLVTFESCRDISTADPEPIHSRQTLVDRVNALKIRRGGDTAVAAGLMNAARVLDGVETDRRIVLVTDGKETCGGDPCAAAAAMARRMPDLVIDVIDVSGRSDLACLAMATGGRFSRTATRFGARDLTDALVSGAAGRCP